MDLVANAELSPREAGRCFDFFACISACPNLLSKNPQIGQLAQLLEEARRNYVPPAPGYPPPADREYFRHSAKMTRKLDNRMRNVEKKSAEMAAKVEQARKSVGRGEEPCSQDPARAFCSFPFWLPAGLRCLCRAGHGASCGSQQNSRQR